MALHKLTKSLINHYQQTSKTTSNLAHLLNWSRCEIQKGLSFEIKLRLLNGEVCSSPERLATVDQVANTRNHREQERKQQKCSAGGKPPAKWLLIWPSTLILFEEKEKVKMGVEVQQDCSGKKQTVNKNKQETDVQVVIMRLPRSIWKRQKHWASLVPCTISIKDTHWSPLPSWCFGIACGERGGGVDCTRSLVNILWLTSC